MTAPAPGCQHVWLRGLVDTCVRCGGDDLEGAVHRVNAMKGHTPFGDLADALRDLGWACARAFRLPQMVAWLGRVLKR